MHRPSTVVQVDAHLRNHVLPFFADRSIASVRPTEVRAWGKGRTVVLAPAPVEVVFRILAAILGDAVSDRLMTTNPAKGVKLPKKVTVVGNALARHLESWSGGAGTMTPVPRRTADFEDDPAIVVTPDGSDGVLDDWLASLRRDGPPAELPVSAAELVAEARRDDE